MDTLRGSYGNGKAAVVVVVVGRVFVCLYCMCFCFVLFICLCFFVCCFVFLCVRERLRVWIILIHIRKVI